MLSPHLDDAVLSLGAAIASASRSGADVLALTVFAYGDDDRPAAPWDRDCGFASTAEARRTRRLEDAEGCAIVGAVPEWLPFYDVEYGDPAGDEAIWEQIAPRLEGADAVLIPGFPLAVPDHLRLARMVLGRKPGGLRVGLYAEQPYASWRIMSRGGRASSAGLHARDGMRNALHVVARTPRGRRLAEPAASAGIDDLLETPPVWLPLRRSGRDWLAKQRAIRAHRSQVNGFGPLVLTRISMQEWAIGGEAVAWLPARGVSSR